MIFSHTELIDLVVDSPSDLGGWRHDRDLGQYGYLN
jgi:hypothetical protein